MTGVPRLVVRVEPIAGETLQSLVARTAHANVFPKLAELLAHAGVGGHPAYAAFTATDRAQSLAELLGVELDEVVSRFHPLHPDQSIKGAVVWAGVRMRRRAIEARSRRVAPMALAQSPHHRLEWTHRALSFCPYTLQQLISACPACRRDLGWVTTKGLDRCERCEASLADADAPMVQTRSREDLHRAAGLISPHADARAATQASLPPEFHSWDTGDLFAAACELGVAWRKPGEGRASATARGLSDASYAFEPDDLACGYALLSDWPKRGPELLERLAATSSSRRTQGRLTSGHLGVLGRHIGARSTPSTLGALLASALDAEAEGVRTRTAQAKVDRAELEQRLVGSIGLVEACLLHEVSRPVLKRLVPNGRSLIAAQPRRQGGIRFDPDMLAATVIAYQSAESFTHASRALDVPRYCLPALIEAGVLERCPDPDAELLFGESAVTSRSLSGVRGRLEALPSQRQTTMGLRSLGAYLRRRFDPTVWAEAFRMTLHDGRVHRLTVADDGRPLIDRVVIFGDLIEALSRPDDPKRIHKRVQLNGREAGRLLGLSSDHLPELVEEGHLKGKRKREGWTYRLGDVLAFHAKYVSASEFRQRHATPVADIRSARAYRDDEVGSETPGKLADYCEVISIRHFALARRVELEQQSEWPDPTLR